MVTSEMCFDCEFVCSEETAVVYVAVVRRASQTIRSEQQDRTLNVVQIVLIERTGVDRGRAKSLACPIAN